MLLAAMAGLMLSAAGAPQLGGSAAAAAAAPAPETARLQGPFDLAGRITIATRVLGERRGQSFLRSWTFPPDLRRRPVRLRGPDPTARRGSDRLTLVRQAPGRYRGSGRFIAPLRGGRRAYAKGQSVPFTITVQVTAAAQSGGAVLATRGVGHLCEFHPDKPDPVLCGAGPGRRHLLRSRGPRPGWGLTLLGCVRSDA